LFHDVLKFRRHRKNLNDFAKEAVFNFIGLSLLLQNDLVSDTTIAKAAFVEANPAGA